MNYFGITIVEFIEILFPGQEFFQALPLWETLTYQEKLKRVKKHKSELEKFAKIKYNIKWTIRYEKEEYGGCVFK